MKSLVALCEHGKITAIDIMVSRRVKSEFYILRDHAKLELRDSVTVEQDTAGCLECAARTETNAGLLARLEMGI